MGSYSIGHIRCEASEVQLNFRSYSLVNASVVYRSTSHYAASFGSEKNHTSPIRTCQNRGLPIYRHVHPPWHMFSLVDFPEPLRRLESGCHSLDLDCSLPCGHVHKNLPPRHQNTPAKYSAHPDSSKLGRLLWLSTGI